MSIIFVFLTVFFLFVEVYSCWKISKLCPLQLNVCQPIFVDRDKISRIFLAMESASIGGSSIFFESENLLLVCLFHLSLLFPVCSCTYRLVLGNHRSQKSSVFSIPVSVQFKRAVRSSETTISSASVFVFDGFNVELFVLLFCDKTALRSQVMLSILLEWVRSSKCPVWAPSFLPALL